MNRNIAGRFCVRALEIRWHNGLLDMRRGLRYRGGLDFASCVRTTNRKRRTGKPVRVRHGPATVIGDENRNKRPLSLKGWEGRGK